MEKVKIKIDVVSDVVCPWCYIGKKRLETAVASLPNHIETEIAFHPFELNPDMPKEGTNQKAYLVNKFGGTERFEQITQRVTSVAAGEGLHFNFEVQEVSPNTFDAHRLIWLAGKEGVQPAVKEALMSAYFEKGVDLSKHENLLNVVTAAGLNRSKAKDLLGSQEGVVEVRQMQQLNYQRKISGVPFYIINNQYGISGAQPADVFVNALTEIGQSMLAQGEICDTENKC